MSHAFHHRAPKPPQLTLGRARIATALTVLFLASLLGACGGSPHRAPGEVVFLIESNPANLDPRFATDGQSQRIGALLFSGLLEKDAEMNLHGDLAESWETPDPLTYIFHLKQGVKFHDGRPLTSRDVKATLEFIRNPANKSPKRGSFTRIASIETPDPETVVFRLKEPAASFLWDMEKLAVSIVPADAGSDFGRHPVGSGPFQFVRQSQDEEVVLRRNPEYFRANECPEAKRTSGKCPEAAELVKFRVVTDQIVRALELRKGTADVEMSSLSSDMIPVLAKQKDLEVSERPGTNYSYLGLNLEDSILRHRDTRQALAYATDRAALVNYLLRGQARLASGILPPNHWAYEPDVRTYPYDPAAAERLLDAAGFPRKADGKRFHLTLKISTEEQARLIGAALQEQWSKIGVDLEVRPLELATLIDDLTKGNFQVSYLRWIGANNDPGVFELVFSSKRIPPDGRNRGRYRNPRVDELADQIRTEMDREKRKALCREAQKILAEDVPYISLWYVDVISVHRRELGEIALTPTGDYVFLEGR